ncbi:MAG: Lrp/AsnC ligand binding domain-containing protein [Candidatus Nitrosoabyssus spongiisocia]|nr:MAG: Lrp/AsnC ligand binding domain-containing protein [Nitrosopumilaceae archaeon AB1(1)]
MNEAYVLLNVDYKSQKAIISELEKISCAKSVKTIYGIYDLLAILQSENMQELKTAIDGDIHNIKGINNMTSLITIE